MIFKLTIREPENAEYDRVAHMWFESWLSTGLGHTTNVTKEDLRQRLESERDWELLIALSRGQVAGMMALKCGTSKLDQLFIDPKWQNLGVGAALVDAAKARLRDGLWLKTHRQNTKAILFYKSHGFVWDSVRSGESDASDDVFYSWTPPFD